MTTATQELSEKNAYDRSWYAALTPEQKTARNRKKWLGKYGLTIDQYDDLFGSQNNACAICFITTTDTLNFPVDHCHTTNVVRGILCHNCNKMLGNAKDNPDTLASAISYLKDFEATQRVN